MLRSATAGQALASDFLRLEAQRDVLEGKQWQCLEDMENRKLVNQQRQKAYADILDRRLRVEGKQQSVTKERNLVIRTEATKLCSGRAEGEAINHIRARKERFGVEVEQMWKDWQQRVAAKIREDIDVARRDAEHCKARQQEAMEVALTQERLLVDLLEAEFLAQKEREKLYEEVEEQQKRLRQRLHEERRALDDRLQAFTTRPPTTAPGAAASAPNAASTFAAAAAPPPSAARAAGATASTRQAAAEAPVTASKACGRAASNDAGFVPKAGTRHFEVYQQLRRNEMEMQADLRLLEDRQVVHCLHCGSTRAPPGSPSGRCDVCGHFVELLQLPPQIARGPSLRVNASQPRTSDAVTQALRLRPAPPALASRGPPRVPDGRVTQPDDVALLLASRPCPSRGAPLESRLYEAQARDLARPASEAMQISTTRLSTPRDEALQADDCDAASGSLPAALPAAAVSEEAHETDDPEPQMPSVAAAPAQAGGEILGSLGILEVPLAPLLSRPESAPRVPALRTSAVRGDNDWYGSSTSGTPRKEEEGAKNAVPPASESSAEDLHFPSGHNSPRGEDKPDPVPRPIHSEVAENTTASDAVPEMERLPIRTTEQEAEDTEEADLDAMIPFSAREKVQRQISPHLQVVEQPQVPIAHGKGNQAARSPEDSSSSLGFASPEVPQEASAGSFSFGDQGQNGLGVLGEASPLDERPARGDFSTGASSTSKVSAPVPVAAAATTERQGGVPAARKTPGILRDLGLDESSDDTPKTDTKEAAQPPSTSPAASTPASVASPAFSKAAPKRSNPLARGSAGRGNLLQGSGSGDFLGGGMPGLGLPGRDAGSGALSSLAALRPKSKARPKIGSLPGGPIDWSQREDFR